MFNSIANLLPGSWLVIGAIAFFLLALLGAALIAPHNRLRGRGNAPLPMKSLGNKPILQIELAPKNSDLVQVFTPGNLDQNLTDAQKGNTLDTFLFIPAYSGLLITMGLLLAQGDEKWRAMLVLVALVAVPLAAVCDWRENHGISVTLHHFKQDHRPQPGDATRTSTPSLTKWTILALVLLVYSAASFRRLGTGNWSFAVIGIMEAGLGALIALTLVRYLRERYRRPVTEVYDISGATLDKFYAAIARSACEIWEENNKEGAQQPEILQKFRDEHPGIKEDEFCGELSKAFPKNLQLAYEVSKLADVPALFDFVLKVEQEEIKKGRKSRATQPVAGGEGGGTAAPTFTSDRMCGLALSGGGIRSATFNLGILQALAEAQILRHADYLSTVSGGGYIGSWLVAWLKRTSFDDVEKGLKPQWDGHPGKKSTPQIEFLRDYSNYLTPRVGLLGADTWAAITGFFRNLLLNLVIFISLFCAVLLLPYLLVKVSDFEHKLASSSYFAFDALNWIAIAFLIGSAAVNLHRNIFGMWGTPKKGASQRQILGGIVAPLFGGIWVACLWVAEDPFRWDHTWLKWVVLAVVGIDLIAWAVVAGIRPVIKEDWKKNTVLWSGIGCHFLVSLAANGWVLAKLYDFFDRHNGTQFHVVAWALPVSMLVTLLAGAFQVGLAGLCFPNELREWTSRLGGWVLIFTLAWSAFFGLVFYSPLLAMWAGAWVSGSLTVAWAVHTISGAYSAFSAKSGKPGSGGGLDILAKTAPPVFMLGLFVLLSFGIYKLVLPSVSPHKVQSAQQVVVSIAAGPQVSLGTITKVSEKAEPWPHLATKYWEALDGTMPYGRITRYLLVVLFLGVALSLCVDINDFSLHLLYRNRLVRCYMGASRLPHDDTNSCSRTPNLFTGFDPKDDILLAHFCSKSTEECENAYVGPFPILNTTLNLTHGARLAWQERMAESFTFTPLFCGGTQGENEAYRPTDRYTYPGGPYLGGAMAISGAAVSPYIGFHTSPAAGFLLTLFNARLSQWLGNPSRSKWNQPGPRIGLPFTFSELFGLMDDQRSCVCLSDGGHFENLGVYELVRRRCRIIIVGDGDCDLNMKFEDLGNAIRKCWADFGADIQIDVSQIRLDEKTNRSQAHFAVGCIQYADNSTGTLIYLKTSLTGDEPTDVLEYSTLHKEFPHETTADQWFDESQFESYRKLGYHVGVAATRVMPPDVYS